ncbi:zinc finger MYM-type 2-like, partial [Brachionus plicatilis]
YAKKTTRNPPAAPGQPRTTHRTKTGTQTSKLRAAAAAAASSATGIELNCPRVYTRQPPLYCPIEAYKIYRSRRPNNCLDRDSPFYLAPLFKSKNNSKTWYKALAMSCQRLDALFYCLFKKAGVDLTSLASMSQQQQQQAVAAAASIMGNEGGAVSPAGWKPGTKEPNHITDVNELVTNGYASSNSLTTGCHGNGSANGSPQAAPAGAQSAQFYAANSTQHTQHIITTVPAQVQVQVQIQVQVVPQHHQQLNSSQSSALTLLA